MRFHLGSFPEFEEFHPDDSWQPFEENGKSLWLWQLKAFPIAIANIGAILLLWMLLTPVEELLKNISFPLPFIGFVFCLMGVLIIHELLHASIHPMAGLSARTIIGFWPSRMLLYTAYRGEMKRNRYLVLLLTPAVVICFTPIFIAMMTRFLNIWMVYITVVNAFLACGDMLASLAVFKLPPNAIIQNQGCNAYWRK